ncbi:MAG: carboxypeptidase-like regulatory domain-containing protein [Alistipes sp.]|nr:carboxypeptidase-like regulatory domain-containing protein [Alistipes sp.]
MKRFILSVICVMAATAAIAQNGRVIKGSVYNENSEPIAGATIQAKGNSFETKSDGSFMITVPSNTIEITVSAEGYLPLTLEVDGSYMVFDLEVDKKYRAAKEKERQAAEKAAAEEAAAKEKERQAAEKRAAEEAAAAEKAATEEAAAKEKARIAAEKAAAAKAKRELKAQIAEECKKHTSGFASVADFSFAIGDEVYAGVEYIAGYRINNHYLVGLGLGANLGLGIENSTLCLGEYGKLSRGDYYFPVFAHFRANLINGRFSPYAALSAGVNIGMPQTLFLDLVETKYNTLGAFVNPQVGVSYRLTPKFGIFAAVGLNCFTAPECIENTGYSATIRQSFNYNININLGVTF